MKKLMPSLANPNRRNPSIASEKTRDSPKRARSIRTPAVPRARPTSSSKSSPLVLHDVQAGAAPVGAVANAVPVDEHVGRMQDDRPIGTRVDQFLRSRRHAGADLDRAELVADVVNPHPRVLVGGEDQ